MTNEKKPTIRERNYKAMMYLAKVRPTTFRLSYEGTDLVLEEMKLVEAFHQVYPVILNTYRLDDK